MDLLDDDIPRRQVLKAAVALGGASALIRIIVAIYR